VDEGAQHLFADPGLRVRVDVGLLRTKGLRRWAVPFRFAAALGRVVIAGAGGRLDLLHLNVSHRGSTLRKVLLAAAARLVGVPYVVQIHTGEYRAFHRSLPGWAAEVVGRFFRRADRVFVLGQAHLALVCDDLGVDPNRVVVLPNAVAVGRATSGLDDPVPTIVFTGRLGHRKAPEVLIDALATLSDRPWRAVLAGDGAVDTYAQQVRRLGLEDRVAVLGWQPRHAVDDLLANAAVFVLPSRAEALSISLLEAMAAGLCCITTAVGAHGEVIDDGRNGLLVNPGEVEELGKALAAVLDDPDLRRHLGAEARRTVTDRFTTEMVGAVVADQYEAVLAARRA
jgi:glycosyltransferase involved in cell wall biosynthesis